jgi:zinc transport system substrate-binding protein
MKKKGTILAMAALLATFSMVMAAGCLDDDEKEDGINTVVVSILPQKEMVEAIVGDDIEVIVMIPDGQSPHSYSPTPGQLIGLAEADLYFKVGSGVEFEVTHIDTLKEANTDMKVVDTSEGITIKSFDEHHGAHDHDHEHDHEEDEHDHEEDEHDHDHEGGTDPHIWLSPSNMKKMADNVLNALIEEDPDGETDYKANHDTYISTLNDAISFMEEKLGPHEDEAFLVYHPAWGYFGDEFHLVMLSIEEEGKAPGPQGVAAIIEQAQEHNITVVFVSPQFESSSAETIADEIGGEVVSVNPLAVDYIDNLKTVATRMEAGLA